MPQRNGHPIPRTDIDPAALALITRRGPEILATARRYSSNLDDAEDAYQRGLEILLTKAPTTTEDELVPWLKTVVKHEAFAIRRQRERHSPVTDDGQPTERRTSAAATHEHAERYDRLQRGAEALRRLKPQEVRALVLRAQGYTYGQICEITGWSYTKVNRCLSEGRAAFLKHVAGIEAGGECERLAPLLSALADGEAGADELTTLRPHLKTCLACRARLREYRAAPSRVAALAPVAVVAAAGAGPSEGEHATGAARSLVESLIGAAQHKAAAIGERAHSFAELVSAQKVAAVAASAAVVAGGGAAGVDKLRGDEPAQGGDAPTKIEGDDQPVEPEIPTKQQALAAPAPAGGATVPESRPQPPSPPDPANEFAPGPSPGPGPAASAASSPAPVARAPSGGPATGPVPSAGGGGEFGP